MIVGLIDANAIAFIKELIVDNVSLTTTEESRN